MTTEIFTRDLMQAISNWQCRGSHDQEFQRGQRLKVVAASLRVHFRGLCRHVDSRLTKRIRLLADNHLLGTIGLPNDRHRHRESI